MLDLFYPSKGRGLVYSVMFVVAIFLAPASTVQGQDLDDEDELQEFFGDDDEEFFEDEEDYLDEEDFDDDEEDEDFDEDEDDDEDGEDDEEDSENSRSNSELEDEDEAAALADRADRLGYTIDISGSSPRYVNEELAKWNNDPVMHARISIEFPLLMQFLGAQFRFGGEIGFFGFKDRMPPQTGELKGLTVMGLLAFPAGPGKVKIGGGLAGKAFGVMAEASYGLMIGPMDLRFGFRTTEILNAETNEGLPIRAAWQDGLVSIGINL